MRLIIPKLFSFWLLTVLLLCLDQNALAQCEVTIAAPANNNLCRQQSVLLTSSNTFNATTWRWFRDGALINDAPNEPAYRARTAGTYTVEASGAGGCVEMSDPVTVRGERPAFPAFTVSPPDAICSGDAVTLEINNAPDATVVYRWNFGDNTTGTGSSVTKTFNSTGTGTQSFTVTVFSTTVDGCISDTATQVVNVRQVPEISFEDDDEERNFEICLPDTVNPEDTTVYAAIRNTTPPEFANLITTYWVDWGDGRPAAPYNRNQFPLTNPNPYDTLGNYTIRMTAEGPNGCEAVYERVFKYNQKPKANLTQDKRHADPQNPDCAPIILALGDSSSGGGLTYKWTITDTQNPGTVSWNPVPVLGGFDQDTLELEFPTPGIYQIELVVSNACGADTVEQSVIVGYPQVQLPGDVVACGDTAITYNMEGGVFFDPNLGEFNSFLWTKARVGGGAPETSTEQFPTFTFDEPGEYIVSVVATNNCGSTEDVGETQPQRVTITPLPAAPNVPDIPPVCSGDSVRIRPIAPGPNYAWYNSSADANPIATGQTFTTPALTQSRSYYVRALSAQGCPGEGTVVNITVTPPIENNVIFVENAEVCAVQGSIEIEGQQATSNGDGTPSYQWQISTSGPDLGFSDAPGNSTGQNYNATSLNQRTWFRRIAYLGDCSNTSNSVEVSIRRAPAEPIVARNTVVCSDSSVTISVTPVAGNRYEWFTTQTGGTPIQVGPDFQTPILTEPTTYYVQAVAENGCPSPRVPVNVNVVNLEADAGEDVTIIEGRTTELRASATGGTPATYQWEPAEGLSDPNVRNPVARPTETTTYTVTITTAEGCTATAEVTVTVIPAIVVPNAFTPNRDGVNDIWEIAEIGNYPDVRVEVFNRWGNLVFTSNGYGTPWDGTLNGEELPVATYYYMIYLNSSERPISGNVTIIR